MPRGAGIGAGAAYRLIGALVSTAVLVRPASCLTAAACPAFATPCGGLLRPGTSMSLLRASRSLARAVAGTRTLCAVGGGAEKKGRAKPAGAAQDKDGGGAAAAAGAGGEAEMSNRAKFRAIPIDPAVMKRIYDGRLTSPMGSAMRFAARSSAEEMRVEKQFKGFSRGPLYRDIPEPVMEMIGSTRKDKLTFIAGALSLESMPPPLLPEVAFCGRSNVGKSSLVNAVTLSTSVRSSDKPGMTQQFNFFVLPRRLMLADLPGYGFAFANPHKMEGWKMLMEQYMRQRKSLKRVYVLIDARHGLKTSDVEFMDRLEAARSSFQVIMTKTDLVKSEDLARRHHLVMDKISEYNKAIKTVRMVSAYTGAGTFGIHCHMHELRFACAADPNMCSNLTGLIDVANDLYKLCAKATDEAPKKPASAAGQSSAPHSPPKTASTTPRVEGAGRVAPQQERAGRGATKRPKRAGLEGGGGKYEGKWGR
jgi:ribosome biogenesis GTP-binding protein YsxC/EngB